MTPLQRLAKIGELFARCGRVTTRGDCAAHSGLGRFLTIGQRAIERPPNDAWIGFLGVSDLASLVDVIRVQRFKFGAFKLDRLAVATVRVDFAVQLCPIILVGQTALRHRFYFKSVGLCAVRLGEALFAGHRKEPNTKPERR